MYLSGKDVDALDHCLRLRLTSYLGFALGPVGARLFYVPLVLLVESLVCIHLSRLLARHVLLVCLSL